MTGPELLEYIRRDLLHDTATPPLWSDDLLFLLLNEAQEIMAEETYCLSDNDSAATFIYVGTGQAEYDLNPSVLHVYSATVEGDVAPMLDVTFKRTGASLTTTSGRPNTYILDDSAQTITVYPTPDQDYTIRLRVARLPLDAITDEVCPEIPDRLHLALGDYVAFRCFSMPDADGFAPGYAKASEASWLRRVVEAKRRYYRLRHGADAHVTNNWTGKRR